MGEEEIEKLSASLGLAAAEFIQKFTRLTRDRTGLSLVEKANGECIFLEGNLCSVQAVKPQQCRDFPNLWRFPGFDQKCQARPQVVDLDRYVELVTRATGRSADYVRTHPHSH